MTLTPKMIKIIEDIIEDIKKDELECNQKVVDDQWCVEVMHEYVSEILDGNLVPIGHGVPPKILPKGQLDQLF